MQVISMWTRAQLYLCKQQMPVPTQISIDASACCSHEWSFAHEHKCPQHTWSIMRKHKCPSLVHEWSCMYVSHCSRGGAMHGCSLTACAAWFQMGCGPVGDTWSKVQQGRYDIPLIRKPMLERLLITLMLFRNPPSEAKSLRSDNSQILFVWHLQDPQTI